MTQKQYRRLTRGLFFFLLLVFFLLYLLLSHQYDRAGPSGGGSGWRNRRLALEPIQVSEVRSSGFIVDEFPFSASTTPTDQDFDQNLLVCAAQVTNTGTVRVNVDVSIHGTDLKDGSPPPQGLCCGFYHHGGEDPYQGDYAAFFAPPAAQALGEPRLTLWLQEGDSPRSFSLAPGETRYLTLCFWVDQDVLPTLTDLDRESYSVTVKLTSRSAG